MDQPNPFDALSRAGELFRDNLRTCLSLGFICLLVELSLKAPAAVVQKAFTAVIGDPLSDGFVLPTAIDMSEHPTLFGYLFFVTVLTGIVKAVLMLFLARATLRMVDHGSAAVSDMVSDDGSVLQGLVAAFGATLVKLLGLFLCCIGIFAAYPSTLFWYFFLVDKRGNGLEAALDGVRMVRSNFLPMVVFGGVIMVIVGINGLVCGSLLSPVVLPFTHIACALAYRQVRPSSVLLEES